MFRRFTPSVLCHRPWLNNPQRIVDIHRLVSCYQRRLQRTKFETQPKEGCKSEPESNIQTTSIIAQKMFQTQQTSSKPIVVKKDKTFESRQFHNRLEILAKEINEDVMKSNMNLKQHDSDESLLSSSKSIEGDSKFLVAEDEKLIEHVILKHDLLAKPKPSPLLGSEDQTIPVSNIPCVGCGAVLHCQHRTIPGFLPSERFKLLSEHELRLSICQRCYYMQHCNAFMEVTVTSEDYAEIISQIKPTRSLVLMVLDVMDISGSIVPNLAGYIGHKHPLIVVGNKADLVAPDSYGYLSSLRNAITEACTAAGLKNLRQVLLISAKTGFGVEKLINVLFSYYVKKVDVFIIGTANAGKSSLFNTLLASDYCRQRARDLIQRATVSVWPGTTLNLLKFPIMRPTPRTLALRSKRLKQDVALKKEQLKQQRKKVKEKQEKWVLKDEIAVTDIRTDKQMVKDELGQPWGQDVFAYQGGGKGIVAPNIADSGFVKETFDESHYTYGYWVYDTPGVINTEQTFNLLDPQDCVALQPVNVMNPRCVALKPATTMYVSGMARLDFIEGREMVILTVHSSSDIPIQVVMSDQANKYYLDNIGSSNFKIPTGDTDRLNQIPSLVAKEFTVEGIGENEAVADIQFSSIGWISVAAKEGAVIKLRAFTPAGKGLHLRQPALLPRITQFKGKRIRGTPFFNPRKIGSSVIGKDLNVLL